MKKNLFYFLLFLILSASAYYFIFRNADSTLPVNENNFAVSDTASVGKIFIADMKGRTVTLERIDMANWTVNGKYEVRPDAINLLLKTIKQLSIKYPVAESARNNVLRSLASGNCKVEIFDLENKLMNSFYVGGGTNDHNGTYMKTINGDNPYVVSIPGFHGVLTVRFITDEEELRSRKIFNYNLTEINQVSVFYPNHADSSFTIHVDGIDSFRLRNFKTGNIYSPQQVNEKAMGFYLSLYRFINAEGFENGARDSIIKQNPFCEIRITERSGKENKVVCFYKPISEASMQKYSPTGEPLKYDADRFYVLINDGKDLVLVQYFQFGHLLQKLIFFKP